MSHSNFYCCQLISDLFSLLSKTWFVSCQDTQTLFTLFGTVSIPSTVQNNPDITTLLPPLRQATTTAELRHLPHRLHWRLIISEPRWGCTATYIHLSDSGKSLGGTALMRCGSRRSEESADMLSHTPTLMLDSSPRHSDEVSLHTALMGRWISGWLTTSYWSFLMETVAFR